MQAVEQSRQTKGRPRYAAEGANHAWTPRLRQDPVSKDTRWNGVLLNLSVAYAKPPLMPHCVWPLSNTSASCSSSWKPNTR